LKKPKGPQSVSVDFFGSCKRDLDSEIRILVNFRKISSKIDNSKKILSCFLAKKVFPQFLLFNSQKCKKDFILDFYRIEFLKNKSKTYEKEIT